MATGTNTITEHKHADEGVALARFLVDNSNSMIEVIDAATGRYLDVNEMACLAHGYSREEFLALTVLDVAPEVVSWRDTLQDLRRERTQRRRFVHKRRDGSVFAVELSASLVNLDRDYVIAVSHDVTELNHLAEQLRQSQKMEAVGRLAGGVAHDFNNLLTVIHGYASLVFGELREDDPRRESLAEILRASEQAVGLTRQLLAFSRKQVLHARATSVNTLVRDLARMLERLIGEDIMLELDLDPALGRTWIDPDQFEQAVVNLVVNARDAMPHGGRLSITTRNDDGGDARGVRVIISDSGLGMDETTASRIFEPFFTTKGQGTGLGLAMVYEFVTQSGGRIDVDSTWRRGTTFTVWLPRI